MLYPVGTQVVSRRAVQAADGGIAHPAGAVGVVVRSPADPQHSYRVRFVDGVEAPLKHDELCTLAEFKQAAIGDEAATPSSTGLFERVILRCVIGSRAYGLDHEASDTDRRGIYLPTAESQWSLFGVPEQLECDETQETYWELRKFLVLALKANPNVLECLYSPLVEFATPLATELIEMRTVFLSRLVYQTYNGYVMSQFKKLQADIRNQGRIKWKHVMHLIRLLLAGITTLREGRVPVEVGEHRESLLRVRRGELPWEEVDVWRQSLHRDFDRARDETSLPERPNYEWANAFLIRARRAALAEDLP